MNTNVSRLSSVVVAVSVALAACAPSSPDGERPPQDTAFATPAAADGAPESREGWPRVVVLGDSLTAGLGLPAGEAYPALLQWRADAEGWAVEVVNAGRSGDTTAGGLRRLDWALEGDVRVLIVALGGNDGLRGLPVGQMKQNLAAILERATDRGIRVLLAGMEALPNFGAAYTAEFRQVFRDLAAEYDVVFVPFLLEGVAGETALNQPDRFHPNAAGTERVAAHLWSALAPMLVDDDLVGAPAPSTPTSGAP